MLEIFRWSPRVEFGFLRKVNFFPAPIENWDEISLICIGTKSRTIGDALIQTTLPRKLKAKYPHLKIYCYPRGFNPVVFRGNPAVDGIQRMPLALYGDDCCSGRGHHIQLKEAWFDLAISELPRPEIYLTSTERNWAAKKLKQNHPDGRPVCVIHPWGHTWTSVTSMSFWTELVRSWSGKYRFFQIGIRSHEKVPGCDEYFLTEGRYEDARLVFALTERAKCFIGVNSGPMHGARAFNIPSLVLTHQGSVKKIFENRREFPYYLKGNQTGAFLYEENDHLETDLISVSDAINRADGFLEEHLVF